MSSFLSFSASLISLYVTFSAPVLILLLHCAEKRVRCQDNNRTGRHPASTKEPHMKHTLALLLSATLTLPASAGGIVIIPEEPEPVVSAPPSSAGKLVLPAIIGLLIIGAIVSGGGDDRRKPDPCAKTGGGDC
jgi:hypothetical protein